MFRDLISLLLRNSLNSRKIEFFKVLLASSKPLNNFKAQGNSFFAWALISRVDFELRLSPVQPEVR
jgi:hypothetical protein